MRGTVVGVLRGGPSKEHDVSLKTGHAILSHLPDEHFTVRDIYIDQKGAWHLAGKPVSPTRALQMLDVAVLGLHGEYGEDGQVQRLLEQHGVPYTGSHSFASYVAMHKVLSKEKAIEHGVRTPRYVFIEHEGHAEEQIARAVRTFPQPVIVKPVKWGSSVGISIHSGHAPIYNAVMKLLHAGAGGVLVEEMIQGTEATAGVVVGLRGEDLYALPPVEIIPPGKDFFSYEAKYGGTTTEICPARFPKHITEELQQMARTMHNALALRHYSRSDFIVSPKGIYYLETNTLPGLTSESLMPKSLQAVGISLSDFLLHLVDLARKNV